jgi:hypothetical protein
MNKLQALRVCAYVSLSDSFEICFPFNNKAKFNLIMKFKGLSGKDNKFAFQL